MLSKVEGLNEIPLLSSKISPLLSRKIHCRGNVEMDYRVKGTFGKANIAAFLKKLIFFN
jgi:hypothetical protein